MSLTSWNRRLKAIEQRPTAQKPLRITGGLPSGAAEIKAWAQAAAQLPAPLCPALAEAEAADTGEPASADRRVSAETESTPENQGSL